MPSSFLGLPDRSPIDLARQFLGGGTTGSPGILPMKQRPTDLGTQVGGVLGSPPPARKSQANRFGQTGAGTMQAVIPPARNANWATMTPAQRLEWAKDKVQRMSLPRAAPKFSWPLAAAPTDMTGAFVNTPPPWAQPSGGTAPKSSGTPWPETPYPGQPLSSSPPARPGQAVPMIPAGEAAANEYTNPGYPWYPIVVMGETQWTPVLPGGFRPRTAVPYSQLPPGAIIAH